ncbi:hypothetical protein QR680_010581 [Steinernema hermaphroditum]|uniref:Major facilitator superfamily (MFS) profile domain-containing protein n=1 Tax=Steinernema hermaphroditum TaxID=289476 RepID=A0AA39IS52_9BILA|nr:hypothetical protein QR680_010581 [Steinernema hermaphroditum]
MASHVYRYVVLVLALILSSFLVANTILYNFTIICAAPELEFWGLSNDALPEFTSSDKSWIITMVAVGGIAGTFPAIQLTDLLGLKISFAIFGILSSVATFLMPFALTNFYYALAARFTQGICIACAFVAGGIIPSTYGNEKDRNVFVAILTCFYQIGPFLAMPTSALFCKSSFGWPAVYYTFGLITLVLTAIFFVVYRNVPSGTRDTRRVVSASSTSSVLPIAKQESEEELEDTGKISYKKMLQDRSFWGLVISGFGDSVGFQLFILYGPTYLNKVLHFEVAHTGLLAAVPYLLSIAAKSVAGVLLDKITCIGDHVRIVSFTFLSQVISVVCVFMLTVLSHDTPGATQTFYTMNIVASGLHHVGVMSGSQIVAQHHMHILSSSIAAVDSMVSLCLPRLVALIAPSHDEAGWTMVFYTAVAVLIITNFVFAGLTKVKPAAWTKMEKKELQTVKTVQ